MKSILAVVIFYVLFISGVQSAAVHFNATTNCIPGCSITDPTIYVGGILPTIDDIVVFNVTEQHCWFHLNSNETYQVNSLTIYGVVGLNLKSNSSLQVIELYLHQVWVHVSNNASLLVHDTAELADNSTVINNGTIFVVSFSSSLSDLLADGNSSFFVEEDFEFENGTLLFSQNSNFTSHETEFTDSILVFYNRPYLGDVEFERVDAQFPNGFIVEDHYVITNSSFAAYFPDELSNVSLVLAGQNNLTVSNLIFASNKIKINSTGSPFITFNVNQNAVFNGSLDVPGEIVVNTGSNIVFNGSINLSGGLKVEVDNDTQIQALGSLTCGNPISLKGHSGLNFLRVYSAVITAPSIILEQFVLTTDGTSQLVGNVINNGAIHIFEESSLFIQGNYSQETNAILGVYNILNYDNRVVNLFINGSAHLDGELKFNATETKIKFTARILEATSIDGKFAKESYDLDEIELFSSRVDYEPNYVSVTITPDKSKHFLGLHWWAWLLIIGGGVILIISIIAFIISRRRAGSYQPIRR